MDERTPLIILGKKGWPVPPLTARQNRIIDPLILSLLPVFSRWQEDKAGALEVLGQKGYEALQEIAYQAITRANPAITRDEFMELPITLPELVAAFPVIAEQTGVFSRGDVGEV